MSGPIVNINTGNFGTKENPLLAGDSFGVTVTFTDPDTNKEWLRTNMDNNAHWNWAILAAPPDTVQTLFGHYTSTPGVTSIGWAAGGTFTIKQSGILRIRGTVQGVHGYPDWKQSFTIEAHIQASKLVGWHGPTRLPVEWVTPDGKKIVRHPNKPADRWLEGYGPTDPDPEPEPEPEPRSLLVVGQDIPRFVTFGDDKAEFVADMHYGGIIVSGKFGEHQVIHPGAFPDHANKKNPGTQLQPDCREYVHDGSPNPGPNFDKKGILFPTMGGSGGWSAQKPGFVYEFKKLYDNNGNCVGYEVLNGMAFYSFDRKQPQPEGVDRLSDWMMRWRAEVKEGHLRIKWKTWHEGVDRKVISLAQHIHLEPLLFKKWEQDGKIFRAISDGDVPNLEFLSLAANRFSSRWVYKWWLEWTNSSNYVVLTGDRPTFKPEDLLLAHHKAEVVLNRIISDDEAFDGIIYFSPNVAEAQSVFSGGPPQDPKPDPKRTVTILDIHEEGFLISQDQFNRAYAADVLEVHHYDGQGLPTMWYQGTQTQFETRFPISVDPDPKPDTWPKDVLVRLNNGQQKIYKP